MHNLGSPWSSPTDQWNDKPHAWGRSSEWLSSLPSSHSQPAESMAHLAALHFLVYCSTPRRMRQLGGDWDCVSGQGLSGSSSLLPGLRSSVGRQMGVPAKEPASLTHRSHLLQGPLGSQPWPQGPSRTHTLVDTAFPLYPLHLGLWLWAQKHCTGAHGLAEASSFLPLSLGHLEGGKGALATGFLSRTLELASFLPPLPDPQPSPAFFSANSNP